MRRQKSEIPQKSLAVMESSSLFACCQVHALVRLARNSCIAATTAARCSLEAHHVTAPARCCWSRLFLVTLQRLTDG